MWRKLKVYDIIKPQMKYLYEKAVENLIFFSSILVISSLILIFIFIGKETLPLFYKEEIKKEVKIKNIFLPEKINNTKEFIWQPVSKKPKYCVSVLFLGTLKCTVVALLFAIPLSLLAAIYTSEFAPSYIREIIKPVIELLAGIPSVVLGFFALMVMATFLQNIFGFTYRLNTLTAGIALSFAVIPIIYTIAEDSLSSVPKSYREASIALGANSWQTAYKIVFPAAFPGIFAAIILGFGRAIGETMIVLMSSGNAAIFSLSFLESTRTLSATIAAELAEVIVGSTHYHILFFIGSLLFIFTFITNLVGQFFVIRVKKRISG